MSTDRAEPGTEIVPADVSFEVELDDAPEPGPPVLVDAEIVQPPAHFAAARAELVPLVPGHLRSLAGIRSAVARQVQQHAHRAAYHALRSPRYLLSAAGWAVFGLGRVIGAQLRWWWLHEQGHLRHQAVLSGDAKAWLSLHETAKNTRRNRGLILAAEAAAIGAGVLFLLHLHRWWPWAIAVAVVLPPLARLGRPADKPIVGQAVVSPRFRVLNADVVLRAYYSARLGDPVKPGMQVTFGSPMARDGDGSRVLVDLPHGLGLKDAVAAKDKIASGLDVTESQVFLRRDPTSYRRHTLWVADRDPLAVPVGRTPLLACKPTDIWKPAPLGLDERGQLVTVPLMWNSLLVGALPRAGKTFSARLLALYAALDPYVKMGVFDAKGSPDWRKFSLVADSYAYGLTPTRDGLPAEILLETLLDIKADAQDRYTRLSELPTSVCPEGKLTRQIARDPQFAMPIRFLVLEEFQEFFDLGEISKDIAALLVYLAKVCPGAGIILVASTQKPSGIGSGHVAEQFKSFRDNMGLRFGLRTSSYTVSDMVLGQGAYSEGLDTSTLLPQYRGVGILRGASDASPTVRTYLADGQDAEKILTAARGIRERAGTLSGMAAGQDISRAVRDVLADVLAVFDGEPGLHWPVLAERLARRFPDRWADATGESVSAQVRGLGVASVDVKMSGRPLKGCRRADVEKAATR